LWPFFVCKKLICSFLFFLLLCDMFDTAAVDYDDGGDKICVCVCVHQSRHLPTTTRLLAYLQQWKLDEATDDEDEMGVPILMQHRRPASIANVRGTDDEDDDDDDDDESLETDDGPDDGHVGDKRKVLASSSSSSVAAAAAAAAPSHNQLNQLLVKKRKYQMEQEDASCTVELPYDFVSMHNGPPLYIALSSGKMLVCCPASESPSYTLKHTHAHPHSHTHACIHSYTRCSCAHEPFPSALYPSPVLTGTHTHTHTHTHTNTHIF
jgi:hypothetical protein